MIKENKMSRMSDKVYLQHFQYGDPTNLNARIAVHNLFSTGKEKWSDFIYRHLMIMPKNKILALGCGNATQWQANSARFPIDCVMHLSDLSLGMLKAARSGLGDDQRFSYTMIDAQNIPFPGQTFDRVTANHMLYHVPGIPKSLAEIKRVLKPGGLFMAATNGEKHLIELYDLLSDLNLGYHPEERSTTRFSLENGSDLLNHNFSHVMMIPYFSDLWVTDAVPLVDYICSMWDMSGTIKEDQYLSLLNHFRSVIQQKGGIFIRKSTGIFLASDSDEMLRSIRNLQAE
jgi:ubiquinone/menaquinone biosynthesis C-methylase UbiE